VPLVNEEQLEGNTDLTKRGTHWIFMVMGHLKPGVTTSQAIADLNSIGAFLEKTYPKDDGQMAFALARPGLYGDFLGPVVQAFLIGVMLLAGLILLAACANLGSLFAARAADCSREVALCLALGASRVRIVLQLFTEAVLIALIGGVAGVSASVVVLRGLSVWQPFSRFPIHVPVRSERVCPARAGPHKARPACGGRPSLQMEPKEKAARFSASELSTAITFPSEVVIIEEGAYTGEDVVLNETSTEPSISKRTIPLHGTLLKEEKAPPT
jgi:hypothetical protein